MAQKRWPTPAFRLPVGAPLVPTCLTVSPFSSGHWRYSGAVPLPRSAMAATGPLGHDPAPEHPTSLTSTTTCPPILLTASIRAHRPPPRRSPGDLAGQPESGRAAGRSPAGIVATLKDAPPKRVEPGSHESRSAQQNPFWLARCELSLTEST